jgi:hypothetical protein
MDSIRTRVYSSSGLFDLITLLFPAVRGWPFTAELSIRILMLAAGKERSRAPPGGRE